jgi:chromosome segregation ATPase
MGNEKYVNYYIELITNTMQDAVLRNVSLQTNARISDEVINEQSQRIEKLEKTISILNEESEKRIGALSEENLKFQSNTSETTNRIIKEKDDLISNMRNEISQLISIRSDYENIKHQVSHVDTFRNELIKERSEHEKTRNEYEVKISELNEKIGYLQLTPAKRKKIEEEKNNLTTITTEKDGGTF